MSFLSPLRAVVFMALVPTALAYAGEAKPRGVLMSYSGQIDIAKGLGTFTVQTAPRTRLALQDARRDGSGWQVKADVRLAPVELAGGDSSVAHCTPERQCEKRLAPDALTYAARLRSDLGTQKLNPEVRAGLQYRFR